jgi:hypothetical protein
MLRHIVLSIFKHATDHLKLVSQRLQPLLAKRLAVLEIARLDCVYVTPNPKPANCQRNHLALLKHWFMTCDWEIKLNHLLLLTATIRTMISLRNNVNVK